MRGCFPAVLLGVLGASACAAPPEGEDGGRFGLRLDYSPAGSFDAEYYEAHWFSAPIDQAADFESRAYGVALEYIYDSFGVLLGVRQHDVDARSGTLAVDDSFEELDLMVRGYVPPAPGFDLYLEVGLAVLAGLDFGDAASPTGIVFGIGAAWWPHPDLRLEVEARSIKVKSEDSFQIFESERSEVSGSQLLFGLSYWF